MAQINIYHHEFKVYYRKMFPTDLFCKWLSYDKEEEFSYREFSFTLQGNIYNRYQSFKDKEDFFKELCTKNPCKIEIGAVYNGPLKNNRGSVGKSLLPQRKEYVFDIDLAAYDDVRFCCQNTDFCNKCWPLITTAIKVLNRALTKDFGYEKLLWIYSGSGVHCWACDKDARELTWETRSAFLQYMTLVKGGNDVKKRVKLFRNTKWVGHVHPFISRSVELIQPYFEIFALKDQCVLDNDKGIDRLFAMIPEEICDSKHQVMELWKNSQSTVPQSEIRWQTINKYLKDRHLDLTIMEILLEFMHPRFNANVSKWLNNLLMSPFSVNLSNGRICVPIDFDTVDEFDPFSVPTIMQVVKELKLSGDVMATSLGKYLKIFEKFVADLNKQ